MPRRKRLAALRLCRSFGLWPKNLGHSPHDGQSPFSPRLLTAGHSPASHQAAKPQRSSKIAFCAKRTKYKALSSKIQFSIHNEAPLTDRLSSPVGPANNTRSTQPRTTFRQRAQRSLCRLLSLDRATSSTTASSKASSALTRRRRQSRYPPVLVSFPASTPS